MTTSDSPDVSFLSYSRWTLKRGVDVADAIELFGETVQPAYGRIQGCLGVTLLEVLEPRSYLAIAAWDSRDDYDAWVRQGDDWREENAEAFKRWQALMAFEEEYQASILAR